MLFYLRNLIIVNFLKIKDMAKRVYGYKDVEMLTASKTITNSFTDNLNELSKIRSNWTPNYIMGLAVSIDSAADKYLGADSKKELRDATVKMSDIMTKALRDLSFLKIQIDVDFDGEAKEINRQLGYKVYLKRARNRDQQAFIQLLYAFKKGMTDELKERIVDRGTDPQIIESIISYADKAKEFNVEQEGLKGTTKEISEEAIIAFNEIYKEIMGICKIASAYYQYEELKRDQFIFAKVIKNMK